jgi:hypothetical protein
VTLIHPRSCIAGATRQQYGASAKFVDTNTLASACTMNFRSPRCRWTWRMHHLDHPCHIVTPGGLSVLGSTIHETDGSGPGEAER